MRVYVLQMLDRVAGNHVLLLFAFSHSCRVRVIPNVGNNFKRVCRGGLRLPSAQ